MLAHRTVRTLLALFFAMILGTVVLTWLDVDPIHAPSIHLTALAAGGEKPLAVITQTENPLSGRWQRIVIHGSAEGRAAVLNSHFVVEPGGSGDSTCRANAPWLAQTGSASALGKDGSGWDNGSIGVCLVGDFSRTGPSAEQLQILCKLVTDLQKRFNIPASRVYLYRDIAAGDSPGPAFPQQAFNESLLAINSAN